eukprot:SAG31_NODE_666_length_12962_cov_37.025033_1_plen_178_part_00
MPQIAVRDSAPSRAVRGVRGVARRSRALGSCFLSGDEGREPGDGRRHEQQRSRRRRRHSPVSATPRCGVDDHSPRRAARVEADYIGFPCPVLDTGKQYNRPSAARPRVRPAAAAAPAPARVWAGTAPIEQRARRQNRPRPALGRLYCFRSGRRSRGLYCFRLGRQSSGRGARGLTRP